MPNPFQAPFAIIQSNFERILPTLTAKAGAIIVEHSDEAFRQQGWTDTSLEPWTPRKSETAKSQGRAILVLSGRLRRSIRVVSTDADSVTVGSDVPYAKVHNEGFTGSVNVKAFTRDQHFRSKVTNIKTRKVRTVKGISRDHPIKAHKKTMRIIKRHFLGNSQQQTDRIRKMIRTELGKCFKIS